MSVNLGDKVKDPVTGIEGIAICRHGYLHGCDRISVARKVKEDGTVPDDMSFDEPQLLVIEKRVIPGDTPASGSTEGPEKYKPIAKTSGSGR